MATELLLLWLAAFPLMGSPGPATISLAGIGAGFGFRKGLRYLLGIILGTFGVLLMIATGVTALILAEPALVTTLTIIAALYIVYLAWRIASAPVGISDQPSRAQPSLTSGFVLAIANPKAFAAIGAVYSSHTLISENLVCDSLSKTAALLWVIVVVNTAWLAFGFTFSRILSNSRSGRIVNFVFAAMLIGSVALAFITF